MRLIKLAIISAVFLFLVTTAMSLLIPSHIRISKATNISGQKDSIFALIKNRDRWPQWHPAFQPDSQGRKFKPIESTLVSSSDSEIVIRQQQGDKTPITNGFKLYHHERTDSLTLQWYMDFHVGWLPWQKFGSLFYENTFGVMMQQGLQNIKNIEQGMGTDEQGTRNTE